MTKEAVTITGVLNIVKKIKSNHSLLTFINFYIDQIKCKSFGSCADRILELPQNVTVQMSGHYTNSQKGWGTEFVAEKAEILSTDLQVADRASPSTAKEASAELMKDSVTLSAAKIENLRNIVTTSGRIFVNFTVGPHKCKSFGVTAEALLEGAAKHGADHPSPVLEGYFSNSANYGTEFVCENVTWALPVIDVPPQMQSSTLSPVSVPSSQSTFEAARQARAKRDAEKEAAKEAEVYERSFKLYSAYESSLLKGIRCELTTAAKIRAIDAVLAQRKTASELQGQPQLGEVSSLQVPSVDQKQPIGEKSCEV